MSDRMRPRTTARTTFAAACLALCAGAALLGGAGSAGAAEACPNEALRTEQHAAFLPDCRAWEMVSPLDKNGLDVITQTNKTHVSTDGNAVTFSTIGGFGEQQGTSFDSEYLARRTAVPATNGWSTHGINPAGGSTTFGPAVLGFGGNTPSYLNAFTPDLSAAVYRSWRPLTDAPSATEVANLYRIDGLGDPGASAQLITDAAVPRPPAWPAGTTLFMYPQMVGASTDLSHVAFESPLRLTADAAPYSGLFCVFAGLNCPTQLYENAGSATRFVGRVPSAPDTECDDAGAPACVTAPSSQAGISALALRHYSERMVSADGSRILFQAPTGIAGGNIYLREDGESTYQLNVSENGPSEFQPAELWEASRDLSRVFFITSESLLPEDTDGNRDLYMYEVEKPVGERLTLVSASGTANDGTVETVVGASDDGRYVYFVDDGQLVPGEPPADTVGLYLWHDGDLSYIGQFRDLSDPHLDGPRTGWPAVSDMRRSRLAPDGRHLLFMTKSDEGFVGRGGFAGYDQSGCGSGCEELYLYSADSSRLLCASCNPSGVPATANAVTNVREAAATSGLTSDQSHALSDDGRYVFFSTAEALVPEDTNDASDAYEYDAQSEEIHLLSSGTAESNSYLIDASNDGRDAFFATRQRLSGWDTDGAYDLYDARAGGGLSEPAAVPAACEGESCLPAAAAAPAAAPTASWSVGPGNPRQRCPKGKRKVKKHGKVRCVKKKAHRKKHRHHVRHERNKGKKHHHRAKQHRKGSVHS
jgi:hypothetical protein